jgi:molecular chaperone DnaK
MAVDCVSLGTFNLAGIPPAPRGIPQIEVTFDIDANGILNVTAKDLGTSKEAKITITATTKLSKDEIEKLKKESEQYSEADKKKKEEAEIKNEADNLVYSAEKLVTQDFKDKIKPEQTEKINKAVQELKDVIGSNNIENLKSKIKETKDLLAEISTEIYRTVGATAATATNQAAGGSGSSSGSATNTGGFTNQSETSTGANTNTTNKSTASTGP